MTARKGIKRLARRRSKATGERYTSALAGVRQQRKPKPLEVTELRDVTDLAAREGIRCRLVVSDALWQSIGAGADEGAPRDLFARLRAMVAALDGNPAHADLCAAVLNGTTRPTGTPNAVRELFAARRFLEQVDAGVRGASDGGRLIALDTPAPSGPITVVGALLAAAASTNTPFLWLSTRAAHVAALGRDPWASLFKDLALAGIGGFSFGGDQ